MPVTGGVQHWAGTAWETSAVPPQSYGRLLISGNDADQSGRTHPWARHRERRRDDGRVDVGRVYEPPGDVATRVLVDRLWPRGMRRDDPRVGRWCPEVAPSAELRRWYGHRPERFEEFARRYEAELATTDGAAALAGLAALADAGPVTLVTATRDVAHSHVAVLARLLGGTS